MEAGLPGSLGFVMRPVSTMVTHSEPRRVSDSVMTPSGEEQQHVLELMENSASLSPAMEHISYMHQK